MNDTTQKRRTKDQQDDFLLSVGWHFAGFTLFYYPHGNSIKGFHTKEQALKITSEEALDIFCPTCGACGEEDCCPPETCNCFYRQHYNKTYRQLLDEHEELLSFVREVKETHDIDSDTLSVRARQLIEKLGYEFIFEEK